MTSKQFKLLCDMMKPGHYLLRTRNVRRTHCYKLFDDKKTPLTYVYERTMKSIKWLMDYDDPEEKILVLSKRKVNLLPEKNKFRKYYNEQAS